MRLLSRLIALSFPLLGLTAPALHAAADLDHDGVSDVWRTAYPAAGAATADPDGDGTVNLAESLAGTSPFSAASVLAATPVTDGSGNLVVRWRGLRGKRYQIESSTDFAAWTAQGTAFTPSADGDLTSIVRPAGSSAADSRRFWRIAVSDRDTDSDGYSDWEEYQFSGNPAVAQLPLRTPFYVFANGNCMGGLTPAAQVGVCQTFGYTGIVLDGFSPESLAAFAALPDVQSGRFRVHAAYWWHNLSDTLNEAWFDKCLDQAKLMGTEIWVTIVADNTPANRVAGMERYKRFANRCQAKGVQFVVYPHAGCVWPAASDGLDVLAQLSAAGYPNVKMTFGLYHELNAGKGNVLAATAAAVKAATSDVVIYGTDISNTGAIKALGDGTYDVAPFLKILSDQGFTQPVSLLTWGLPVPSPTDPTTHLARSMKKWRQLIAPK
jgi:sugar phosphate isomerase/epimerase